MVGKKTVIIVFAVVFVIGLTIIVGNKTVWNLVHTHDTIQGVVYDRDSGQSINNAKVILRVRDSHFLDFFDVNVLNYAYTTNDDGSYLFDSYRGEVICVYAFHNDYYPDANDEANGDIYLRRRLEGRDGVEDLLVNGPSVDVSRGETAGFSFLLGGFVHSEKADIVFEISRDGKSMTLLSQKNGGFVNVRRPSSYGMVYQSMVEAPEEGYEKTLVFDGNGDYDPLCYVRCADGKHFAKLNMFGFYVLRNGDDQEGEGIFNFAYTYQKDGTRFLANIPENLKDDDLIQAISILDYIEVN